FTAVAFDLLCMLGLVLVGLRYGDRRLAASLAFARAAFPFTEYVANTSSNDTIQPAILLFAFWLAASPWGRGGLYGLASWTKFAWLALSPLWLPYPSAERPRRLLAFLAAFFVATAAVFFVLLFDGHPIATATTFWHRTFGSQLDRDSPFSLWDWRQYHA